MNMMLCPPCNTLVDTYVCESCQEQMQWEAYLSDDLPECPLCGGGMEMVSDEPQL